MSKNNFTMRVCLGRKRMFVARKVIILLGSPTHLSFWYDEENGSLIISAASKDDLDAYEIPQYFWKNTKHSCEVARIAFLKALQFRIGWNDGERYLFSGTLAQAENVPAAVFNLTNGARIR